MKSITQIKEELAKVRSDKRLRYSVLDGSPLALVQSGLKGQIEALKWVLCKDDKKKKGKK